uniref:Uncharacterized protein n=1 Tax=Anguilla anguilla TaxID=7936 RepID=A0A0E9V8S7_ANGAN
MQEKHVCSFMQA